MGSEGEKTRNERKDEEGRVNDWRDVGAKEEEAENIIDCVSSKPRHLQCLRE